MSSKGSVFVAEGIVFLFLLSRIQENNHELLLTCLMAIRFFFSRILPHQGPTKSFSKDHVFQINLFFGLKLGDFFRWKKRISPPNVAGF